MNFALDNLNQGATQVVLSEWKRGPEPVRIKATLTYTEAASGKQRKTTRSIVLNDNERQARRDSDLLKNYTIAIIADSIQEAARQVENENLKKAIRKLERGIKLARTNNLEHDEDVDRIVQIARKYRATIDEAK